MNKAGVLGVELARVRIIVRGVVQGVGFRPFVYQLAMKYNLKGWVCNTSEDVKIEVEGETEAIEQFLSVLREQAPPRASIEDISTTRHPPANYEKFEIRPSIAEEGKYQLISPDIATCPDCLREILSSGDRRYRYPFTNCTNCGPRFTIIKDIPYDRPKTTMAAFQMCPSCEEEYHNPSDRRFHAQPNACPECGPRLKLVDGHGNAVDSMDVIKTASALLKEGRILAIKGLGGFHLACDATSEEAVRLLRDRKRRPAKPLAVMIATLEGIERHCRVSDEERQLLQSPECPIVLLRWQRGSSSIVPAVAPGLEYLGVMLPYTPLHHILLRETGLPLVMTSGNLSEEPIAKDNDEALTRLNGIADYFLLHDRDIYGRYDDSVYMVEGGRPHALRRARGYAPYPVFLPFKSKQVLACGAEEKNTFCLTRDNHAFISQHIGDMENEETLEHFESTVELYKKLFRLEPEVVAYDMHPEYLSTGYARQVAEERGLKMVPAQHHHAHIVSCMIENNKQGPVIGVAFDGTGYGTDGTIWGGEFLVADWHGFQRAGHLEYVPLPGGAAAIKKPYRTALGYLYTLRGEDLSLDGLPLSRIDLAELALIKKQIKQGINSPLTSSAGRLFDAVSALAGVRQTIDYEAQAAIELEMLATDVADISGIASYPFSLAEHDGIKVVKLGKLISAVVDDARNGTPAPLISLRFHHTVAQIIARMCQQVARDTEITQVVLSGGVFQNRLLLRLATAALEQAGLNVLTHHLVPCNDGGISLGQAAIANFSGR